MVRPTLKDDAERVVKKVPGVTRVINQIEVLPLSPNDDRIRMAEFRAIYGDPALQRYALGAVPPIHIIVKNGHVDLVGVVATQMDKQIAGASSCGSHSASSVSAKSGFALPVSNASGAPQSYADVVDRVTPAVVTIRSARRLHLPTQFPFFNDPFFRELFGERSSLGLRPSPVLVERALGSGVIVSDDGNILTNHHVVDGADQISVRVKRSAYLFGQADRVGCSQ